MIQIRKIVNSSLAAINVFGYGENPDPNSSQICLDNLRYLLDELAIRYVNYKKFECVVTAKNGITLGTDNSNILTPISGDFYQRPANITKIIHTIDGANYDLPLKTYEEYREIRITETTGHPYAAYIDYSVPYTSLYFYPIPSGGTIRVIGNSYLIDDTTTLNDYLPIPEEFVGGIVSNLTLRIAPYFGVTPGQDLIIRASSDMKHIKQVYRLRRLERMENDYSSPYSFDYRNGGY
jgi:hypothetical protein